MSVADSSVLPTSHSLESLLEFRFPSLTDPIAMDLSSSMRSLSMYDTNLLHTLQQPQQQQQQQQQIPYLTYMTPKAPVTQETLLMLPYVESYLNNMQMLGIPRTAYDAPPDPMQMVNRQFLQPATNKTAMELLMGLDNYVALNDIGYVLRESGHTDAARNCFARAIELCPQFIAPWINMAVLYKTQNEPWLAIHYADKALLIDQTVHEVHVTLADLLREVHCYDRAIQIYNRALELSPNDAYVHAKLGQIYVEQGKYDMAVIYLQQVVDIQPDYPEAQCSLGNALFRLGRIAEAEICYLRILQQQPNCPSILTNMANVKQVQGNLAEAKFFFGKAVEFDPNYEPAHSGLGILYQQEQKVREAFWHYSEAARLAPNVARTHHYLGNVYRELGDPQNAIACYQRGLLIDPTYNDLYFQVGLAYKDSGNYPEAMQSFTRSLMLRPDQPDVICNAAHCQQLICDFTGYEQRIQELNTIVDKQLAEGKLPSIHPHHTIIYPMTHKMRLGIATANANLCLQRINLAQRRPFQHPPERKVLQPGERLRIGYVSSDFGNHPTSHLMQSVPGFHDRTKVEIFCYSLATNDGTNFHRRIIDGAEHYFDLSQMPCDMMAAQKIYDDKIHVLVNLNGYTKGARNEIFALTPAPVQVMWLGYPGSSGAPFMDYIITDNITSPLRLAHAYSEKLAYMPHTYFIGDHAQMFKHLAERVVVKEKNVALGKENLTLVNAMAPGLEALAKSVELKGMVHEVEVVHGPDKELIKTEMVVPIVEIPTTEPLKQMIGMGLNASHVGGVPVQNGAVSCDFKTASGEQLPQTIMVTSRQQYSLPDDAVVYCNFNQLYKIDPPTVDMWIEILKRVPNSVIWLLRFPVLGETNLKQYCADRGINPNRLCFTNVAVKEEHVRRGQLADVCLDTPLCNGHTTGMDVLWSGTPMVTMPLETLASRVAASQLYTLGVPELVAKDRQAYIDISVRLGNDRDYLLHMRNRVWKARHTSTLFNVKQFCTDFETLAYAIWNRHTAGEHDHVTDLSGPEIDF